MTLPTDRFEVGDRAGRVFLDFSSIPQGRRRYPLKWLEHCFLRLSGWRLAAEMSGESVWQWFTVYPVSDEMLREEWDRRMAEVEATRAAYYRKVEG